MTQSRQRPPWSRAVAVVGDGGGLRFQKKSGYRCAGAPRGDQKPSKAKSVQASHVRARPPAADCRIRFLGGAQNAPANSRRNNVGRGAVGNGGPKPLFSPTPHHSPANQNMSARRSKAQWSPLRKISSPSTGRNGNFLAAPPRQHCG